MPRNTIGPLPFPPLVKVDTDDVIAQDKLADLLRSRLSGLSMCVRSATGHNNRGGYFFHIHPKDDTLEHCDIYNIEKIHVHSLPLKQLTALVNHCAGLAFDEDSFQLCQTLINFRLDPTPKTGPEDP